MRTKPRLPRFTAGPFAFVALLSLAVPTTAQVLPYGAGVHPSGSLVSLSGVPAVGEIAIPGVFGMAAAPAEPAVPELVPILPDTFFMGSDAPNWRFYWNGPEQQPVHRVTISLPFWMGRYEVTQSQYAALMGENPAAWFGPDHPVQNLTWFDAMRYCAALNDLQTALGQVPPGYQYRLPTEAEWEYACRAGTTTEFHFGPELSCGQAKFAYSFHTLPDALCGNPWTGPVAVGSYAPNAWGLHDMHGNVREWCLDGWSSYSASAKTDPFTPVGTERVIRGGSWIDVSSACRSANRDPGSAADAFSTVGFRVVLAPIVSL